MTLLLIALGPCSIPLSSQSYHNSFTMPLLRKTTDMGWPQTDALWIYTLLPEPTLSDELQRLSFANSIGNTDVVSFQPCPNPEHANQDRFVIKDWPLANGTWTFRAIFDGHAGHETADYAAAQLPDAVKDHLTEALRHTQQPVASAISDALTKAISSFDKSIGDALVNIFPDQDALAKMSDEEIQRIINDDGPNSEAVVRCMRGTTVLVTLVDPSKSNMWVASLGDCAASKVVSAGHKHDNNTVLVLGTKDASGRWTSTVLSSAHNGENKVEADRVRSEHPGEQECVMDDRVLGAIAVTRAVGDFSFKLPAVYTNRVFLNSRPGFVIPEKVRSFIGRNLTPPYMSGTPDVEHIQLSGDSFLIMCTDGMMDLYEDDRLKLDAVLSKAWVRLVGENLDLAEGKNLALQLLRDGLGGTDEEKVSRMITVEMAFRWIDDTTIIVLRL
ncbi:hypothetical protein GALMADRAFT_556142 [Galerina marginata CBS 339.88]|uniref:PPM-type phosphatase domain-containing protein n=1 Tax=Galerina marginata (strain CBS 339.88) TaxID=685588 RepID=A0A067T8W8_GALM3|nr:hypothetical protein GALMADRAFT_556142 [Galerina marginata CBS 339.88]